ncbi:hypothetical protein EMIT036CA2_30346 [Chryseobacterium sp. IT-36CA2]
MAYYLWEENLYEKVYVVIYPKKVLNNKFFKILNHYNLKVY